MKKLMGVKIALIPLMLAALACVCNGGNILESVASQVEGTLEAETGANFEELQQTAEAAATQVEESGGLDSAAETAEAMIEDAGAEAGVDIELQVEDLDTDFPIPAEVISSQDVGGTILIQTSLSIDELVTFYRQQMEASGYIEREINTSITDTTASMVFDGHPSGQAMVVQITELPGVGSNVTLFFEDI